MKTDEFSKINLLVAYLLGAVESAGVKPVAPAWDGIGDEMGECLEVLKVWASTPFREADLSSIADNHDCFSFMDLGEVATWLPLMIAASIYMFEVECKSGALIGEWTIQRLEDGCLASLTYLPPALQSDILDYFGVKQ